MSWWPFATQGFFPEAGGVGRRSSVLLYITGATTFLLRPEMAVILVGVGLITYCSMTRTRVVVAILFFPALLIIIGFASSVTASYAFNMEISDPFMMLDQFVNLDFSGSLRGMEAGPQL